MLGHSAAQPFLDQGFNSGLFFFRHAAHVFIQWIRYINGGLHTANHIIGYGNTSNYCAYGKVWPMFGGKGTLGASSSAQA